MGWKPHGDIAPRVVSCKQVLRFPGLEHIHLTGKAGGSSDLFSALGCKHKWNPARTVMAHTQPVCSVGRAHTGICKGTISCLHEIRHEGFQDKGKAICWLTGSGVCSDQSELCNPGRCPGEQWKDRGEHLSWAQLSTRAFPTQTPPAEREKQHHNHDWIIPGDLAEARGTSWLPEQAALCPWCLWPACWLSFAFHLLPSLIRDKEHPPKAACCDPVPATQPQ